MAPRPQLACAALLLAAAHVDAVHLMVREVAEPEDDCHTAVAGDACHKEVIWAMTKGITQHRWWYPGLHKNSSTFEDFQEFLHKLDAFSAVCAKPCRIVQQTKGCHTAVKDEVCHNEVTWAMKTGIHENPSWYPGLTPSSSFEEFQTFLHSLETFKSTCMMPCTAEEPQGRERAEDTARAQKAPLLAQAADERAHAHTSRRLDSVPRRWPQSW
ncbi:unnamed protein product [Prorocentrum cordatum]|uniref:Uncharacterized protein n=1 Tax=Prorocentrum cordatum TaxID=2364126 RepID=A0ABN9WLI1_9DINO|nr:unnamed protein product [Polarella glacialis]